MLGFSLSSREGQRVLSNHGASPWCALLLASPGLHRLQLLDSSATPRGTLAVLMPLLLLAGIASITLSRRECAPAVNFSFERNRRGCLKVMCGGPPGNRTLHHAGFLGLLISQATCRSIREQPLQSRQPTQMHPARPTTHHLQFLMILSVACAMACHPVPRFRWHG